MAKHFTELGAWRLADDLRQHIYKITDSGPATRAFAFRDQIREAADSACDNVAEGFGRYRHRDFANFLTISIASLEETESKLLGGFERTYFSQDQLDTGRRKVIRARRAILGLKRYLDRSDAPPPFRK